MSDGRELWEHERNEEHRKKYGLTYDEWKRLKQLQREIREYEEFMDIERKRREERELASRFFGN